MFPIEIDANGSPVTIEAADWLVCFVPGLRKQWWHGLANRRHKHVFAMRRVHAGSWILVEPWWSRLMVNALDPEEAARFLRWAALGDVLEVREAIPGRGSQARGWSNCAVLVSFMLGRSYWTWTPAGLYRRLLAEEGVKQVDPATLLVHGLGDDVRTDTEGVVAAPAASVRPYAWRPTAAVTSGHPG